MDSLLRYLPKKSSGDPPLVWHYTTQEGLLGILKSKSIWMTKIQYLNDSKEFSLALDLFNHELEQLGKKGVCVNPRTFREISNLVEQYESSAVYVASFSETNDSLSQWRAYSGGSNGFSIAFRSNHLEVLASLNDAMFHHCIYDEKEHSAIISSFFVNQFSSRPNLKNVLSYEEHNRDELVYFVSDFMVLAPFLKHKGFDDEKEWRFVWRLDNSKQSKMEYIRPGGSMLIPFIELPLVVTPETFTGIEGVFIGPTPHPRLSMESVRASLLRKNVSFSILQNSKIPFRNW
jgi:hypothetical protein